ncbi:MAG: BamA/TamA family outer membrane protein [Saprospiraceae bacterium]
MTSTGFRGRGLDARHYIRLDKRSILAFRAAGAWSFGNDRILYYMGGADNELFGGFNTTIPTPEETPGFVTLANSMRGFSQNIRNGNAYVLANAELRIPVFRYLSERIQSPFLRNFQVTGFFDAGTAWSGDSPYSDDNPLIRLLFPLQREGLLLLAYG